MYYLQGIIHEVAILYDATRPPVHTWHITEVAIELKNTDQKPSESLEYLKSFKTIRQYIQKVQAQLQDESILIYKAVSHWTFNNCR